MPDKAHEWTDEQISDMEKQITEIYTTAQSELQEKWDAYMDRTAPKVQALYDAMVESGYDADATAEYKQTLTNMTLNDNYYRAMVEETTAQLANTNQQAVKYLNGEMPRIYTVNANSMGKAIEGTTGVSFALVDASTVEYLSKTSEISHLPQRKVNVAKDMRWNTKKINSQVMQGILQGESIIDVSKRLQNVIGMNKASSIRNARTMCTEAENKGRIDTFHRAEKMGLKIKKVWMATGDEHTRAWHLDLDGVSVGMDDSFENDYGEIEYPADPTANPANVYNCRCTLVTKIEGYGNVSDFPVVDVTSGQHSEEISAERKRRVSKKPVKHIDNVSNKPVVHSENYKMIENNMLADKVEYNKPELLTNKLSDADIIEKISGGDKTEGSCASLSFAYTANKGGLDVLDFRGGNSRYHLSLNGNIQRMATFNGVESKMYETTRELKETTEIVKNLPLNKQYIVSAGKHCALVMNDADGGKWLELQSTTYSGWHPFNNNKYGKIVYDTLKNRWGCRKTADRSFGKVWKRKVAIIDVDSLSKNGEFRDIVGYLNTTESKQKKGVSGYAK